jgi:hypothetical protein
LGYSRKVQEKKDTDNFLKKCTGEDDLGVSSEEGLDSPNEYSEYEFSAAS